MKELTVEEWNEEINDGLEYRRTYGLEDEWPSLEAMFYSIHETSKDGGDNLIAATGDSLLSQLNVPKPSFLVKAKRPDLSAAARVVESVDNSLIEDLELDDAIDTSSLHAFLFSKGIIKFGYDSEFGYDQNYVLGEDLGLTMTQFDINGKRIEFGGAKPGMPWCASCLPHDIVVPYGVVKAKNSPWVAHRVVRHVEDIKKDVKYENKKMLQPIMSMEDFTKSYLSTIKPYRVGKYDTHYHGTRGVHFCELWEIHDRRTGKIYVIATGHSKFLRNEADLMQLDGGLPFVDFGFIKAARTFWTTPLAYYLKPNQAELADITHIASLQRRISVLKFLYGEDALEDGELDKILSPRVGVGAKVKGGIPLKDAIAILTAPNNNPMLYNDAEFVRKNARETVGFSRNQAGEYEQTGRRTAHEAQIVKEAADLRISRKGKVIKRVYEESIRKINQIIFEFWKTNKWTEVAGPNGAAWISYVGNNLRGDYAYETQFSPASMDSLAERKQMALQMYAALSQDKTIDQVKLRIFLVNAFNDREFADLFGGIENLELQNATPKNQGNVAVGIGKTNATL